MARYRDPNDPYGFLEDTQNIRPYIPSTVRNEPEPVQPRPEQGLIPYSGRTMAASTATANPTPDKPNAPSMNPYLSGAALGLDAIGLGLQTYGAIEGQSEADKNFKVAQDAYAAQLQQARAQAEEQRKQQELENAYKMSTYQAGMTDRDIQNFKPYNRAIGR